MSVIVFGSINMDLVARTPRLPAPGETLIGHEFTTVPGGKGANQAVAAARLEIPTTMVGRVGSDTFGAALLQALSSSGVNCDRIAVETTTGSGVAIIAVDDASENTIVVIPGANGLVDQSDVERLQLALSPTSVLMLQLEIPLLAVVNAAKAAKQRGATVMLDPAPAQSGLPAELYTYIDIITPNQVEASQLVGFPVETLVQAEQAAQVLRQRGAATALIKLGKLGAICATADHTFHIPSFPVAAVDTVAAGDAFNGGLAAGLAEGLSLPQAMTQAAAVAALAVSKPGAQSSLPTRAELVAFLARQHP
ncbi:ribokinase [Pantanalinema sp. GBBB05]|uniref:ribokinase n=1 Tax=Pantanalinema sp. GBBB05 TaxID=2604139 RepID=UPI001DE15AFD|nr:ribokinase [Pantanalinema sp. GBBB05]